MVVLASPGYVGAVELQQDILTGISGIHAGVRAACISLGPTPACSRPQQLLLTPRDALPPRKGPWRARELVQRTEGGRPEDVAVTETSLGGLSGRMLPTGGASAEALSDHQRCPSGEGVSCPADGPCVSTRTKLHKLILCAANAPLGLLDTLAQVPQPALEPWEATPAVHPSLWSAFLCSVPLARQTWWLCASFPSRGRESLSAVPTHNLPIPGDERPSHILPEAPFSCAHLASRTIFVRLVSPLSC